VGYCLTCDKEADAVIRGVCQEVESVCLQGGGTEIRPATISTINMAAFMASTAHKTRLYRRSYPRCPPSGSQQCPPMGTILSLFEHEAYSSYRVKRMKLNGRLSIGQLSKATGVKVVTIRYYEQIKLMPSPLRTEAGSRVASHQEPLFRKGDHRRLPNSRSFGTRGACR